VATALALPGLIEQTGTHRRIIFGEVFGNTSRVSDRVSRIHEVLAAADIQAQAVPDARVPLWEKFVYLAPFAAFTGAARLPFGPLWRRPEIRETFMNAVEEVARLARAEQVELASDFRERITSLCDGLPPTTRSSLLVDLTAGRRIEVEALQGAVVRRGRAAGVPTPIMAGLYSVLKPWEDGSPR
jgi:2-dehydropantoate 2-reductase